MAKVILDYAIKNADYSDGDSEEELLSIYRRSDSTEIISTLLKNTPAWAIYYHITPIRENLLSWYNFNPRASLLEVGAGCGALTGLLCKNVSNVTAVELTERRANILYERHKQHDNLSIYVGNLNDLPLSQTYDYVTCIGVLEYAGKFTTSQDPYVDFLKKLQSYLTPDGTLILAIENKFGIKYWSGAREDHTGHLFESIENYPNHTGITTFGRTELENILRQTGFTTIDFYYPLPDYKLPTELFSDSYLPTFNHNIRPGVFPTTDLSASREYIFDEKMAMDSIITNQQFSFFANSFLVFAKN